MKEEGGGATHAGAHNVKAAQLRLLLTVLMDR